MQENVSYFLMGLKALCIQDTPDFHCQFRCSKLILPCVLTPDQYNQRVRIHLPLHLHKTADCRCCHMVNLIPSINTTAEKEKKQVVAKLQQQKIINKVAVTNQGSMDSDKHFKTPTNFPETSSASSLPCGNAPQNPSNNK